MTDHESIRQELDAMEFELLEINGKKNRAACIIDADSFFSLLSANHPKWQILLLKLVYKLNMNWILKKLYRMTII